jgi:hypothetical protein
MNAFDNFCNELLEQSKRFNENSKSETKPEGKVAYQHASLLLAICALEAYVNGISEEITLAKSFPIHEKGILLEKEIKLEKGEWITTNSLKISRLTDKIELLYKRHTRTELDETHLWWTTLKNGIDLRNKLTHPKDEVKLSDPIIEKIINAVIECVSILYKAIYKRQFPKSNLSLVSKLDF